MTRPPAQRAEAASPHGLLGYVVAEDSRTRNALRLLRWSLAGAVLLLVGLGALFLVAASASPAAWLCGGATAATAWRAVRANRRGQ
ncbi:hypothetical protein ACOBQX_08830 [Actinokineospora sp. G85]|uniref:hypothetical protein n=1 Tax=Actinokineospora sp. G85 TaxID=3406626 RepID=UPI003C75FDCE